MRGGVHHRLLSYSVYCCTLTKNSLKIFFNSMSPRSIPEMHVPVCAVCRIIFQHLLVAYQTTVDAPKFSRSAKTSLVDRPIPLFLLLVPHFFEWVVLPATDLLCIASSASRPPVWAPAPCAQRPHPALPPWLRSSLKTTSSLCMPPSTTVSPSSARSAFLIILLVRHYYRCQMLIADSHL